MKIVDILIDAAQLLGLNEESAILENATEESELQMLAENEKIKKLFTLYKYAIREICTNYIPYSTSVKINTTDKQYSVGLLENYLRVQSITKNGELVKYKIINRNITFEEDGEYEINYASYPLVITMFEDINFLQEFSPDIIVLNLCAYFSLAYGLFEEFETFHEKYISRAESLKNLRIFDTPCRRWEWETKKVLK